MKLRSGRLAIMDSCKQNLDKMVSEGEQSQESENGSKVMDYPQGQDWVTSGPDVSEQSTSQADMVKILLLIGNLINMEI